MKARNKRQYLRWLICCALLVAPLARGFPFMMNDGLIDRRPTRRITSSTLLSGEGFGVMDNVAKLSPTEVKSRLLELLPSMMGTDSEFRLVESYVNALEDAYVPAQTIDFLNLCMAGEWQLVRLTNTL